ncbi:MAG: putative DNA-binding protein (MmcQ/YjbR family) [Verrucomicrobiales bacterium]|jgi:predicted DNA-binding protein (MmcQ/YjbR family)
MNDIELLREALLLYPEASEETPFGPETLVYKVAGKMFATLSPEDVPVPMNLKCDPDRAIELRDEHEAIEPGYHMNKRHWNTLRLDGSLPDSFVLELIRHSVDRVLAGCTKAVRERVLAKLG